MDSGDAAGKKYPILAWARSLEIRHFQPRNWALLTLRAPRVYPFRPCRPLLPANIPLGIIEPLDEHHLPLDSKRT